MINDWHNLPFNCLTVMKSTTRKGKVSQDISSKTIKTTLLAKSYR